MVCICVFAAARTCIIIITVAFLLLRLGDNLGFGIVLDHASGHSRRSEAAGGDASFRIALGFVAEFIGVFPGNIPCNGCVLIYFQGRFLFVRGIPGGLRDTFAIVAYHGKGVHVIIDNSNADSESLGAVSSRHFTARGVVHVGGIHRHQNRRAKSIDIDLVIKRDNAVAVPVGKSHHARNANRIAFAGIFDFVFGIERIVRREGGE